HEAPPPRDLHSFPTRRSSDLAKAVGGNHQWRRLSGRQFRLVHRGGELLAIVGRNPDLEVVFLQRRRSRALLDRRQFGGSASRKKDRKSTRLNSSHVKISYAVF